MSKCNKCDQEPCKCKDYTKLKEISLLILGIIGLSILAYVYSK